ncbi:MAG TPA: hypothetical protein PKD91_10345 [Bacteroidia bacterium]|nr:hypothetical protein [Bacteroidia bacterium]
MNEELKLAVIKALQKNHKNGPINAKNLAGIYENIITENQSLAAEKIASMINDAEMNSDNEADDSENEE